MPVQSSLVDALSSEESAQAARFDRAAMRVFAVLHGLYSKRVNVNGSVHVPIEDTERVQHQGDVTRQPREWKGQ
jgi:hypothetical protein